MPGSSDLADLRDLALRAATSGAEVVRRAFADTAGSGDAESKGFGDYVTATDRAAEEAAVRVLRDGAAQIAVLAEESAGDSGRRLPQGRCWAVDPLDGTTNFVRRYPVVGVSVGLLEDGVPVAGAIVAPMLSAHWSGAHGLGAHDAAGRRLQVRDGGGRGVAATGFPFRRPENRPRYLAVFDRALETSEDLRRAGAACLDLAYSAQGSLDGFFELGLSIWDVAAGGLLVLEAGGVVSDWDGDPRGAWLSGDILAGAPAWHERMLDITRAARAAATAAAGSGTAPATSLGADR